MKRFFTTLSQVFATRKTKVVFGGVVGTLVLLTILLFVFWLRPEATNIPQPTANNPRQTIVDADWSETKAHITQAEQLIAENKFDEADALLASINKKYPEYEKVQALLELVKTKRAEQQTAQSEPAAQPQQRQPTTPQPAQTPALPQFSTPITIRGDASCQADTLNALQAIANSAPGHYSIVTRYVSIIECVPAGSAMYAYESPPRYAVGDGTRSAGLLWYASTIVHDANHSRLYHEGKEWTGGNAEKICLDAQANSLSLMGGSQSTIDYVNSMKNDPYWQTPVEDRYW